MDLELLVLRYFEIGANLMVANYLAMDSFTDEMLVIRAQADDTDAFGELMRRTFNRSLKVARYILTDLEEAEDQVQNSYLKAWLHLSQFEQQSKFSTWVYRIVTNQCLMRLRQLRGRTFVYLDDCPDIERVRQAEVADCSGNPEKELASRQLSEIVRDEITRLPPLLRHVLVLRDLEENPTAKVAESLGITEVAVKSRLTRARNEVRTRWTKREARPLRRHLPVEIAGLSADAYGR